MTSPVELRFVFFTCNFMGIALSLYNMFMLFIRILSSFILKAWSLPAAAGAFATGAVAADASAGLVICQFTAPVGLTTRLILGLSIVRLFSSRSSPRIISIIEIAVEMDLAEIMVSFENSLMPITVSC